MNKSRALGQAETCRVKKNPPGEEGKGTVFLAEKAAYVKAQRWEPFGGTESSFMWLGAGNVCERNPSFPGSPHWEGK